MQSFTGTCRLAQLLLTLQLMIPAQMLQGTEQSTVVGILEVMKKSSCQPMEQLVDVQQEFPEEVEYIYIPPCVPLRRCSGCCSDDELQCHPTSQSNITMQVMQVMHMVSAQKVELTFAEHHACECSCSSKKRPRTRKQKKKGRLCGK
ncbi:vascular endothelial growth factor A-like [Nematolebias whitei]|uniref:vascular endothelial growth factor A-like n=1 Tax=Nematolebias whitei TaxID=451745 RepID=UPI00189AF02C|nr:vascular endothelial growth factor A-like [Nematolebias whitei]